MTKGVILLSGGLDSLVSLDIANKTTDIELALIFNYGQSAYSEEKEAAIKIAKHYKINYKIVNLPYLKELSQNKFKSNNNDNFENVWIPNRNGLFLNIAATFCEAMNCEVIIFGANKKEAAQFPDNSQEFVEYCNKTFNYSTLNSVKVCAPCLQFDKIQIINYAIDNSLPLGLIKSCYNKIEDTGKKHCGRCMSCKLLGEAILKSKKPELIKELF